MSKSKFVWYAFVIAKVNSKWTPLDLFDKAGTQQMCLIM